MHRARRTVSEPHALWAMTGRSHLASAAGTPRVRTGSCSVLTVRALVAAAFLRRRLLAAVLLAALVLLLLHLRPVQHAALERVVLLGASLPVVPDADARWVTHVPTSRISASSAPRRLAGLRICVVAISPSTSEPAPRPDGLVSAVALALLVAQLGTEVTLLLVGHPPARSPRWLPSHPSMRVSWIPPPGGGVASQASAGDGTRHAGTSAVTTREALLAHAVFERLRQAPSAAGASSGVRSGGGAGAGDDDDDDTDFARREVAGAPAAGGCGSSGFDIVHFVDCAPLALYALLAQQQRLALCGCAIAVHAHAPLRWRLQRDSDALGDPETASEAHMERHAFRLAGGAMDAAEAAGRGNGSKAGGAPRAAHLLLSSASIGQWLRLAGQLEAGTATLAPSPVGAVLAPILEMCSTGTGADAAGAGAGRLGGFAGKAGEHEATVAERVLRLQMDWASSTEVSLVCNALTLLHRRWRSEPPAPNSVRIEFATRTAGLGPRRDPLRGSASYDGRAALAEHARRQRWWLPWTFAESQSRVDAPQKRTLRLLLLPLLSSSAAAQLINAARCRLPLLTIAAGGNAALLRATDRAAAVVAPDALSIAARLHELLHRSLVRWPTPRLAADPVSTRVWWRRWHAAAAAEAAATAAAAAPAAAAAATSLEQRAASRVALRADAPGKSFGGDTSQRRAGGLCEIPAQPAVTIAVLVLHCEAAVAGAQLERALRAWEAAAVSASALIVGTPQLLLQRWACRAAALREAEPGSGTDVDTRVRSPALLKWNVTRHTHCTGDAGATPSPLGLLAAVGHALSATPADWTLLVTSDVVPTPATLCVLLRAAHASGGGGGAGFSAAARLWSGSGAARASEAHLPLGSSLAVGVLRNTLGTSALLRTSELLPLLAADSDLQARPEPCDVAVWQLLARAAASGLRIDPVPFLVLDVHCSGSGGGRGDWDCNERGDGRSLCADVLPLRRFLARRIAAAGRDGNRPSSASAGWVPDALDLADVLLVLQAHT